MLTFSLDINIPDDGGKIILLNAGNLGIYSISYGTDTTYGTITAPASNQSAYYNGSGWQLGTPTKGWCNSGFTGCPTISSIISLINSQGIKTNLGDQSDYSRITGLYFQKSETNDPEGSPIVKITFVSEMNFTDKDALV